jgi:hypothetical protein
MVASVCNFPSILAGERRRPGVLERGLSKTLAEDFTARRTWQCSGDVLKEPMRYGIQIIRRAVISEGPLYQKGRYIRRAVISEGPKPARKARNQTPRKNVEFPKMP